MLRLGAEVEFLLLDVVAAMLARGFDADGVVAGLDQLTFIVFAVPGEGVVAGRAGGGGDGLPQRRAALGLRAAEVVAVPLAQVGDVARLLGPESDGADGEVVFILDPDGDVGTAEAEVVAARQGEVDGEFEGGVPEAGSGAAAAGL